MEAMVNRVKDHPALYVYELYDEPAAGLFASLAHTVLKPPSFSWESHRSESLSFPGKPGPAQYVVTGSPGSQAAQAVPAAQTPRITAPSTIFVFSI